MHIGNGIKDNIIYKICRLCMPINANASQLDFTTTHESKEKITHLKSSSRSRDNDGSLSLCQKVLHEGTESGIEPRMTCRFTYNRFMMTTVLVTYSALWLCLASWPWLCFVLYFSMLDSRYTHTHLVCLFSRFGHGWD